MLSKGTPSSYGANIADTTPVSSNAKLFPVSFSGTQRVDEPPTRASSGKSGSESSSMIRLTSSSAWVYDQKVLWPLMREKSSRLASACVLRGSIAICNRTTTRCVGSTFTYRSSPCPPSAAAADGAPASSPDPPSLRSPVAYAPPCTVGGSQAPTSPSAPRPIATSHSLLSPPPPPLPPPSPCSAVAGTSTASEPEPSRAKLLPEWKMLLPD
mmetsp:Transcript_38200/g.86631  ORF Transcript_38200/g.86631 Transcript_38200/m.86631 type:complete len:212 (-) Transcript_38200:559-1194(-)